MSDRYKQAFSNSGKHAFIPFTMLGWPTAERCLSSIQIMIDEGATALELGIAFSDPVADGPVIQKAAFETLERGFSVQDALALVKQVRQKNPQVPIGLLMYYNVVLANGVDQFYRNAAATGVDSLLIADLPPDAAHEVVPAAERHGVSPVFIASPLTSDDRLRLIAQYSRAYIYVVSRLGITGTQETHDDQLGDLLRRARKYSHLPLCVGFGVSSPQAAQEMLKRGADGVITGSKVIELISNSSSGDDTELRQFLRQMRQAVTAVGGVQSPA